MKKELHPDFIAHWSKINTIERTTSIFQDSIEYFIEIYLNDLPFEERIAIIFDDEKENIYRLSLDDMGSYSELEVLRRIKLLAFA